jgi:hypothetical protein
VIDDGKRIPIVPRRRSTTTLASEAIIRFRSDPVEDHLTLNLKTAITMPIAYSSLRDSSILSGCKKLSTMDFN